MTSSSHRLAGASEAQKWEMDCRRCDAVSAELNQCGGGKGQTANYEVCLVAVSDVGDEGRM